MQLNPHLSFSGQCDAAFRFYEKCLGGKIEAMVTFADTPMAGQIPGEWRGKIAHARLCIGDQVLMGGDPPPQNYEPVKGCSISITVAEPAEAERLFHALAEGGTVRMPMQKTFWSARFGMFTDRFGIPWMINCEQAP